MSLAQGIDISVYQPKVDWPKVQQATGISFVLVKASQSNWPDPLFAKHWADTKAAGLLRGAYHFLRQAADPQQQVTAFLNALGQDPGELAPILDIEDTRVTDPAQYAAAAQLWLQQVENQLHRRPIIYTGGWWWDPNMLIAGHYPAWAGGYPLWVASWPLRTGVPTPAQLDQGQFTPVMPKSWTTWQFWQYTGDLALVDGITDDRGRPARVDLDVFNGTVDDLRGNASPVVVAVLQLPDPRVTNQIMINAFSHAFGPDYWLVVQRAGLAAMADQRAAQYAGPAINALAALSQAEQAALEQKLTQLVGGV